MDRYEKANRIFTNYGKKSQGLKGGIMSYLNTMQGPGL